MKPFNTALFSGHGGVRPPRPAWKPGVRAPLGALPQPENYALPDWTQFPQARDLNFIRGNFGITIPGAPAVPGSNDQNPAHVMSSLLLNYPQAIQEAFLAQYVAAYTHVQFSLFHALHYGATLDQYIALAQRAQSVGLFVDHWFLAGEDVVPGGANQPMEFWKALIDPHLPRLVGAGVVDQACVGWQLDQYNVPGNSLIRIIKYLAEALPATVPLYTHWVRDAMAWWWDGGEVWSDQYQTLNVHDRFTWWQAMSPYLTGGHMQGDTVAARSRTLDWQNMVLDTLNPFRGGDGRGDMGQSTRGGTQKPFQLVIAEYNEQDVFNGVISEHDGDAVGYALMGARARDGAYANGYYNGASRPTGEFL